MTLKLPEPISAYYNADQGDRAVLSGCFTDDAVVIDEKKTYTGRKAIQEWKTESAEKYTYIVEPFALENVAGKTVVTAHVTGNFPGSPVDLRYFFGLKEAKIASLEIKL